MKASIVVVLALLAFPMVARGAGEIRETPGTHVYQPRSNQTSSNTKVIETRSYANVSKAYIDGEGDLTCHDVTSTGTLTVSGAAALNGGIAVDSPAFTVADTSGNVATTGTLNVTGKSTLGAVDVSGTVAHTGVITGTSATDITINTDKFKVTGSSGATTVAGLLTATGGIAVNTSAFTVATSTGNVATTGTLTAGTAIAGATLIPIKGIMSYASASTNIAQLTTGTTTNTDFALTGVAVGDGCLVLSPPLVSAADSALVATCVAKTDNITLKLSNTTAGTLDPDDQVYTFMIIDRT